MVHSNILIYVNQTKYFLLKVLYSSRCVKELCIERFKILQWLLCEVDGVLRPLRP
jgi:hypothetical protein